MSGRAQTVDIIRSLVTLMGVTVLIDTITDNGNDTYTLETENTYWIQPSFTVTIDSEDYTVVSVVRNTSFIISGTNLPTVASFNIAAPSYFHGTLIQTKLEILDQDIKTITPMIYCLEELVDYEQPGDSSLDRKSDVTLYFITQANFSDYLTADYLNNCHYPMRAMCDRFIEVCKSSSLIGKLNTGQSLKYTNINQLKVRINSESGKNLFDKDLSGVRLEISEFPINKIGCQTVVSLSSNMTLVINVHGELQSTTVITRAIDETINVVM